ncbi:hypothetical protein KFK09_017715 [Dendrobium nobile]|uniref:RING-type E3 ubiquitin transferase n=1 Tax=Dendrobium nobile TaxID=94219 RepID=A0A8T3ATR3_DENNO|nr:hypothetical protein KFK09_017715 [Dendrobium nobile]
MKHSPSSSSTAAFVYYILLVILRPASALVRLRGSSFSFTFIDAPARFAIPVDGFGACGSLHIANPLDACSALRHNSSVSRVDPTTVDRFVLIERGHCSFDRKVRVAQEAGFQAAIIFDDQDIGYLYSMIGNPLGIHIHAVFVSKMAGETLQKYAEGDGECCIGPPIEENAGTVLVISFVSVVAIISVIAAFLFARNCWILRNVSNRKPSRIEREEVEILPCFIFKRAYLNTKRITETCAICLEDYQDGETLRLLPCLHDFHLACVDSWLTKWGTFCPICKQEMNSNRYQASRSTFILRL